MGAMLPERNGLPSSVMLPEKLIHRTGRVIPGQLAGVMGKQRDPGILASSRFNPTTYGAWPEYEFDHQRGQKKTDSLQFRTPGFALPEGVTEAHFNDRLQLLNQIERRNGNLGALHEMRRFSRYQERAISMLGDGQLNKLFDIHNADPETLDRYGRNTFGWSLMWHGGWRRRA